MDKTSVFGIVIGLLALGVGMVLKGVSMSALANPAAILIIVGGTVGVLLIAFPMEEIKKVPKLFKVIFTENKGMGVKELIPFFSDLAQLARQEGILALDSKIGDIENNFLQRGLRFAIDGQNADYIRAILSEEIDAMEQRHSANASIFAQAGTYAPTLGVLGAVIGLISALGNMQDMDALGHAISAAFIATLLGIFSGYVLWHPFANKLKRKSKLEAHVKEIMIEGILSIIEGEAPRVIEEKLASYLPESERDFDTDTSGGGSENEQA